jgi:hypothetical protein
MLHPEWKHIRADIIDGLLDLTEAAEDSKLRSRLLVNLKWMHTIIDNQLKIHRCKIPPTVFHIASSQAFFTHLKQDTLGGTSKVESQLREFVTTWRHDMDEYLATLVPNQSAHRHDTHPKRLLELATTFFDCPNCSEPISYPRILMHNCMIQVPISGFHVASPDNVQEVTAVAQSQSQARQPRPRRVTDWNYTLADIMKDLGSWNTSRKNRPWDYLQQSRVQRSLPCRPCFR